VHWATLLAPPTLAHLGRVPDAPQDAVGLRPYRCDKGNLNPPPCTPCPRLRVSPPPPPSSVETAKASLPGCEPIVAAAAARQAAKYRRTDGRRGVPAHGPGRSWGRPLASRL
jgi:hypothetical protein